ncbi:DUF4282 domain-containing protein [Aquisalimonas sp.]|uniref:DUF4282 domain-containing protein n=1 Tax=unclassified Aquisalimonas TaxID=2644645 RepID=UPI0025C23C67|nr:DUF4282 domain-containing protein [Aquisalimonas sp.]
MSVKDFFFFDRMIAPILIKILFWLGLVVIVLSGLAIMFSGGMMGGAGMHQQSGMTFGSFLGGLFYIVFAGLFLRVFCEFWIVLFSINDRLREIRDNGQNL